MSELKPTIEFSKGTGHRWDIYIGNADFFPGQFTDNNLMVDVHHVCVSRFQYSHGLNRRVTQGITGYVSKAERITTLSRSASLLGTPAVTGPNAQLRNRING